MKCWKQPNRITVQIATRNRWDYLASCLSSLYAQTYQNFDVVIADDFSDDKIDEPKNKICRDWIARLQNTKHRVKHIRNPCRLFIGKTRNMAFKEDDMNDLMLRLDDDSWCEPDYLEKLVNVMIGKPFKNKKEIDLLKIGAVGGIVPYLARPPYYKSTEKLVFFNRTFCDKKGENLSWNDDGHFHWHPRGIIRSHHLRSSWLFRREALESVGLFEEWVGPTGFGEETITCLKMLAKQWYMYTDTAAKAWHLVATDPKKRDMGGRPYQTLVEENKKQMKKVLKPHLRKLYKRGLINEGQGNLL